MNKGDFIKATALKATATAAETEEIINAALAVIAEALTAGEPVKLARFGTFESKASAKAGRNFSTGEAMPPQTQRRVSFTASDILKAQING